MSATESTRRKAPRRPLHLLTVREVQVAQDGDHADGGGLLLRIAGAHASWVFRFTSPIGRRREMGLGTAQRSNAKLTGDSLTTARNLAREQRDLLALGVDPIDERDKRKAAAKEEEEARRAEKARKAMTLAQAARDYHAAVIEPQRTPKHAAQWLASLENHVPAAVWKKPLSEVTARELLDVLTSIKPHERARNLKGDDRLPETTRRIRQRLDAIFEHAAFLGHVGANPAAAVRRKLAEQRATVRRTNHRAADYREMPAIMARLQAAPGTAARALTLLVLTASRTSEVLGARWSEIDLDARTWTLPADRMKGREQHVVFLSDAAVRVLDLQRGQDAALVFPSPASLGNPDGHRRELSNMSMLVTLDRLGLRDATSVHGFRASFSTWANATAAARPDVIEACLAHREADRVRAAYNRTKFDDERRALLDAWAKYLASPAAAVVPLRSAA